MFAIASPTIAKLNSLTPRIERHGDESVPAVSLGLSITGPNTLLDLFSDSLRHTLYKPKDDTPALPGIDIPTPLLRTRGLERIKLKVGDMVGYRLTIENGIDSDSDIDLHDCKVDKWNLEPFEGGSIELSLRIGTSDLDETYAGRLAMKLGQEVSITLTPPEKQPDVIDGTQEGFERDQQNDGRSAGDLFAAQHGGVPSDDEPEPTEDPDA